MTQDHSASYETPITLIQHAANCDPEGIPNTLSALEKCLSAGAAVVEIDIIPLTDGSFALLHDPNLGLHTNGTGNAAEMKKDQIEGLFYRNNGSLTGERVGFLTGAVNLLQDYPGTKRLQIDFKPFVPLPQPLLDGFLSLIAPVIERIQVSSYADWVLRDLKRLSPTLSLGFDPFLYFDLVKDEPQPENVPPFRVGAYGLLDDHPMSAYRWGTLGDYFAVRAEALLAQAPEGCDWFIRAEILKMALDAGYNWIEFLHGHGSKVDGWTIDVDQPAHIDLANFLIDHGIDALTTDSPRELAKQLNAAVVF